MTMIKVLNNHTIEQSQNSVLLHIQNNSRLLWHGILLTEEVHSILDTIWSLLQTMVPFGVTFITQPLLVRVPKKGQTLRTDHIHMPYEA